MSPASRLIDLEEMLRGAISSGLAAGFARGIGMSGHIDNRLPLKAEGDMMVLTQFLRQGVSRSLHAPATRGLSLALWLDEDTEPRVMLEVARLVRADRAPTNGLAALWSSPLGVAIAQSEWRSTGEGGYESVMIPLPVRPREGGERVGARFGNRLRGKHVAMVSTFALSVERMTASMAAIGAKLSYLESVSEAEALLQAGETPPFILVLDSDHLGEEAGALARKIRAEPELDGVRILLLGDHLAEVPGGEPPGLFDLVLRPPMPWRRLRDALHELAIDRDDTQSPQWPPSEEASVAIPDLTGKRVLIAEDVATNQLLLRAMLAPTGADIEVVADGRALVERHTAEPADLIVLDLQMPKMGGIAAIREVRAMSGKPATVQAVALTAYARQEDRRQAIEAGMDGYLAKPVVVGEFYGVIGRLIGAENATC